MARRPRNHQVLKELEDAELPGVELDPEPEPDIISPYDPKLIRVDPKVFSVRQILDMIDDRELDLAPDFQRRLVWHSRQKSLLIESLLLRIPLPAFYFSADAEGLLQVVDGVQRLSTIYEFVRDDTLSLDHLEYLGEELRGKTYSQLSRSIWGRRILNTQISANVIDPQTPIAVKFDIFRRINTGGSPLNAQEIRHCMSRDRSRSFLKELCENQNFIKAVGPPIANSVRMVDRELALRYVSFSVLDSIKRFQSALAPISTAPAIWSNGSSTRSSTVAGSQRAMTSWRPTILLSFSLRRSGYGCALMSPRPSLDGAPSARDSC